MKAAVYQFARLVLFALCAGFTAAVVSLAMAADPRDDARAKAEADRRKAEHQRKFDEGLRNWKATQDKKKQQDAAHEAPAFDPTGAPPPEECLKGLIMAAKNAKSMDDIIDYVPQVQRKAIQHKQANYDPQAAADAHERLRGEHPEDGQNSLNHVSRAPNDFFLNWYKDVANSIIDIKSVKIEGNKAKLVVSIHRNAVVNGEHYGYSDADVEMVGEGNYWKLLKYKPDILVYKAAP